MNDQKNEIIPLLKPYKPPLHEMTPYLEKIWASQHLTNGGPFHAELEKALCNYLKAEYISLFSSGTLALMIALKILNLKGEVITTPFTFPASVQALHWNNLKPVFADIYENDFNIDPLSLEGLITPNTCAILPVHTFGLPCRIDEITRISEKYNLPVIYDAAHSFGVLFSGTPLCNYGDLSVVSFHATKVFNTLEGGAVICHDESTKKQVDALKNNGIGTDYNLNGYGLNAKMNELQSAFGLCHLKHMDEVISGRQSATSTYKKLLQQIKGIKLLEPANNVKYNYTYLPVIIDPDEFGADRDELHLHLLKKNIITRKYFYPLVIDFPEFNIYKTIQLPVAKKISENILCLPLFHDISDEQLTRVVRSIKEIQKNRQPCIR